MARRWDRYAKVTRHVETRERIHSWLSMQHGKNQRLVYLQKTGETTSPTTRQRYERLLKKTQDELEEGRGEYSQRNTSKMYDTSMALDAMSPRSIHDAPPSSETAPLLRVLRKTKQDGTYRSLPSYGAGNQNVPSTSQVFRPIVYAEKALGSLLHGALLYLLFFIIGLGMAALKFEAVLFTNVTWWVVFGPFWIGNVVLVVCHFSSITAVKKLRRWAEDDVTSNEPLLPLLRQIVPIYAVSIPLMILLFWSEMAFCGRLENPTAVGIETCFAPLILIEVALVFRYMMCKATSHIPGISWTLILAFTILLDYQTNTKWVTRVRSEHHVMAVEMYNLSWWMVLAPLFGFDLFMFICLCVVLFNICFGVYRLERWQFFAVLLYAVALVFCVSGQFMLTEELDLHFRFRTIPSIMIFTGLVCSAVALYLVCRQYVKNLMASRGGSVPVPLTRTVMGWMPSGSTKERWLLLGDVSVQRKSSIKPRTISEIETDVTGRLHLCTNLSSCFGLCSLWGKKSTDSYFLGNNGVHLNDDDEVPVPVVHTRWGGVGAERGRIPSIPTAAAPGPGPTRPKHKAVAAIAGNRLGTRPVRASSGSYHDISFDSGGDAGHD